MVAFLDIQGFKNFLETNGTENTYAFYKKEIYSKILGFREYSAYMNGTDIQISKIGDIIGFYWFSDSIILYSKKDQDDYLYTVLSIAAHLLESINSSTPIWLRCGVSYGEMSADPDGILIGAALIEAYKLEESQNWFGGALTNSAADKVEEMAKTNRDSYNQLVTNYPIPMKTKCFNPRYALNWPRDVLPNRKMPPPDSADPRVQIKYENTMAFYREVKGNRTKYDPRYQN